MRPDQHKKKRSAQYKKTHPELHQQDLQKQPHPQQPHPQQPSKDKQQEETAGKTDRDNEESEMQKAQPGNGKYHRRKVTDNWHRYEGDAALDVDTSAGNYTAVLDRAISSGTSSQFVFKPEDSGISGEVPEILSLDCAALVESLAGIPLHTRLGIDASLISADELDNYTRDAERYSKGSATEVKAEVAANTSASKGVPKAGDPESASVVAGTTTQNLQTSDLYNTSSTTSTTSEDAPTKATPKAAAAAAAVTSKDNNTVAAPVVSDALDDELDELLAL